MIKAVPGTDHLILHIYTLSLFAQVQDFRRNILSVCEDAVMERTASDRSMVLYSYPPNLGEAGRDEIDGVELIEVDVCFTTSDGRLCKTLLNVGECVCVCVCM